MAVASNSYTHTTWVIFWGSGSLVESTWCHYIRVEADSHIKLLPAKHTKCLRALVCCPWIYGSSLEQLYPHYLGQMLGFLLTCGVKMISLCHGWGWQPTQTASCTSTLDIYKVLEHIDMLSMGIWQMPQTVIPTLLGSDFGVLPHLWSRNDCIMSLLRLTDTSNCFLHPY